MHRIRFAITGFVLSGVTACSVDSPSEATTVACRSALVSSQGMTAQGISAQGVSAQGFNIQGLSVQGLQVQGVTAQGVSVQGVSPQGVTPQGLGAQGITPQGLTVQGLQAQGFSGQGLSPQGLTAQGLTPQGIQAQGLQPQGIQPQGLQGVALRGATAEEANLWLSGAPSEIGAENIVAIALENGVLRVRTNQGASLEDSELVGLLLPFSATTGEVLWIRLSALSTHPDASDVPLYSLELEGENLCGEGGAGLFVPGIWDEAGTRHDSVTTDGRRVDTTYACTRGVITKCVAWGYRPWTQGSEIHEACVRMARADYCGDGVPHTEEGTMIDMFDTRGIQTPVADDGFTFEAGWGPNGAVCVNEPRYVDTTPSGDVVYPSCWSELPSCESFGAAVDRGALLGNDSAHTVRALDCAP
jgi:hypothetical protein